MIFSPINLRNALIRRREHEHDLLHEVQELLETASSQEKEIIDRLKNSGSSNLIKEAKVDCKNIFSLTEIREICIRYRLRFLESSLFKSDFPYSAIAEINLFEKKYSVKIKSFYVVAPSKAFDLENINKDPLLFAKLSNNSYYLIHQWGKELAWYRRILSWPVQDFKTLMITLGVICALFAFALPSSIMHIFNFQSEMYLRIWLTIHTFIGLLGISLWLGLSFDKTFSKHSWNSKYYNY